MMDFTILPYDRLPKFIREDEKFRQILLQSGGIMKYVAEHIDDPTDDDTPQLFVQYQNHVAENYRRANRYNPNRQNWSIEDLRQRALNGSNHLWNEFQSRRIMMQKLRMQTDMPFGATSMVNILNQKYLEYAWKEDLRRRRPDIETNLGIYKYVMHQFERFGWPMRSDGLACRSIDIVLKLHHGCELTETDIFDCLNIEMFHTHFFGPRIIDHVQRGLGELLHKKNAKECRAEAMGMLKSVQWFSQHIYNDEVEDVLNDSFTIEDKKWLRSILEHYNRDQFGNEELNFFYFGKLFAELGSIWEKHMRHCPGIELDELEEETKTIININPYIRQITWEEEKQCFKEAVLRVMKLKKENDEYLFENNSQWRAIYRFVVDFGIMYDMEDPREPQDKSTPQYTVFKNFAHELQFDSELLVRRPFRISYIDCMKKPMYAIYCKQHPWSAEGLKNKSLILYKQMNDVYNALKQEYFNLIHKVSLAED